MGCLENMNYEILAKNCSFKEAREIIRENCSEKYEVPAGFKLLDKPLLGIPPILSNVDNFYPHCPQVASHRDINICGLPCG